MRPTHQNLLFAIALSALTASAATAQSAPPKAPPAIYVTDFTALYQNPDADGRFHHLRTMVRQDRADGAASTLAKDMVKALNAQGAKAYYLGAHDPRPASGWLVGGVFQASDTKGLLAGLLSGGAKTPNTDVTVSITDLASTAPQPFATIGETYALKGQGSLLSTNPYEVAAKFVVHTVAAGPSINSLSGEIAAKILASRTVLEAHDAGA